MKKIYIILLSFILLTLCACTKNDFCTVSFIIEADGVQVEHKAIVVRTNQKLSLDNEFNIDGYRANQWFLNEERTELLPEEYIITKDIVLYASLTEQCKITYVNYDNSSYIEFIDRGTCANKITLEDSEMEFLGWYDRTLKEKYNFSKKVNDDLILYAKWDAPVFTITYDLGFEYYESKNDLYVSYFSDFYDFLITKTDIDMESLNVSTCEEFLEVCADWNAYGQDSFYGVGDVFKQYYLTVDIGGSLEDQPTDTFVGYCYQKGKYLDFLPHLITFFGYWRTDEGYTGSVNDPENLGNDFFAEPWASLVDTCKFFKFTSENLNDTYSWFRSERVKNALDNIPSVINISLINEGSKIEPIYLPKLDIREGYKFVGWYDEFGKEIEIVNKEMTVFARWEKK